jgi:hypothetical protein
MKISFFENTFYLVWNRGERRNKEAIQRGEKYNASIPDRSFLLVAIYQYVYFMFFVSLIIQTFSNETIIKLYELDTRVTILPFFVVFTVLFWGEMKTLIMIQNYMMLRRKYIEKFLTLKNIENEL